MAQDTIDLRSDDSSALLTARLARSLSDTPDHALVELVLTQSGLDVQRLSSRSLARLRLHCRDVKEAINANTRKIYVELGRCLDPDELRRGGLAEDRVEVIKADEYEKACEPLIARTLELVESAVPEGISPNDLNSEIAGVYVVGGASALPAVARSLRSQYGRRVHRSPYPSAAIAIGLAIAGDVDADYQLTERFQRSLGVFREAEGGRQIQFDRIIGPETELPGPGGAPRQLCRRYRASHNVGHFRFVECGDLGPRGEPAGDITPHADVRFPFAETLRARPDLDAIAVERLAERGPLIEERYEVDAAGIVAVTITDLEAGYGRSYVL